MTMANGVPVSLAFKHTAQNFKCVVFLALRCDL